MVSTFAFLALSAFVTPESSPNTLAFQKDYTEARQLGRDQSKPLAVFIGSGENGWEKICNGKMDAESKKLLAEKYVCVYVNRDDERGKKLAADFEAVDSPALIISSRKGDVQAFRHTGEITADVLTSRLQRYADGNLAVETTETLNPTRASFYGPNGQVQHGNSQFYQSYYPPNVGGGCANGRCR